MSADYNRINLKKSLDFHIKNRENKTKKKSEIEGSLTGKNIGKETH